MPEVDYSEPILTVRRPQVKRRGTKCVMEVEVSNHGQVASEASDIDIRAAGIPTNTATCPGLEPYGGAHFV